MRSRREQCSLPPVTSFGKCKTLNNEMHLFHKYDYKIRTVITYRFVNLFAGMKDLLSFLFASALKQRASKPWA